MRLRSPGAVDSAIGLLTTVKDQLYGCRSGPGSTKRAQWLAWWERADPALRSLFADDDLVLSLYQARSEISREQPLLATGLADRETDVWIARLEEVISQLRALKPFIERPGEIIVPDTSALIEGVYFTDFNWASLEGIPAATGIIRLIVPVLVMEELNGLKTDRRAGSRSRSVLRRLWELHRDPTEAAAIPGKPVTVEVLLDGPWHVRRAVNDDEIIQRAAEISEVTGKSVVLAAGDYAMLYRAAREGLKAALMPTAGEAAVADALTGRHA